MDTVRLIFGFALILFGLSYPLLVLWQLNRQMSRGDLPPRPQLVITLVLSALWPLTAVLAGFWLLSEQAQSSLVYNGALAACIVMLLITLIANWRLNRRA
jgi:K+-transporting ATPase c subunit